MYEVDISTILLEPVKCGANGCYVVCVAIGFVKITHFGNRIPYLEGADGGFVEDGRPESAIVELCVGTE